MAKYVGSMGRWDFFIATPESGEYPDPGAIEAIQHERFKLITHGRPIDNGNGVTEREPVDIFCTGITLDYDKKLEKSLFDGLPETYHIFALGNDRAGEYKGNLGAACSCAREVQDTVHGGVVGLPHENKVDNGYPPGYDLDRFRETYTFAGKKTHPGNRIELYRHFKPVTFIGDKTASFGTYRVAIHEFIIDRLREGKEPISKWLFCSKPGYYEHLYRLFASMLTPLLDEGFDHIDASPSINLIKRNPDDHTMDSGGMTYATRRNGSSIEFPVSYRYPIIRPDGPDQVPTEKWYDFMSQVIDIDMINHITEVDKQLVRHRKQVPCVKTQIAWRVIGKNMVRAYQNPIDRRIGADLTRIMGASPEVGWDDNVIREQFDEIYREHEPTLDQLEMGLFEGSL